MTIMTKWKNILKRETRNERSEWIRNLIYIFTHQKTSQNTV